MEKTTIERHFFLPSLKAAWNGLYRRNPALSAFQSFDFMLNLWKNYWVYGLTHRELPVFYVLKENGQVRMIAPLCRRSDGCYEVMGNKNGCEYCDLIYAAGAPAGHYVTALLRHLNAPVRFARMKATSPVYLAFAGSPCMAEADDVICTNIPLADSYDAYYRGLSSSMRQNLRTAFNRLRRDGHEVSVRVVCGGECCTWSYADMEGIQSASVAYQDAPAEAVLSNADLDAMLRLYYERHEERYAEGTSRLKMWYVKHLNFVTRSLRRLPSAMNVMLYIDRELAAFMSGFVSSADADYIVPRLSISGRHGFYSPGMLLVNETARYLTDRTPYRNLDLSMGTEAYKLKMGGVKYSLKRFVLRPE